MPHPLLESRTARHVSMAAGHHRQIWEVTGSRPSHFPRLHAYDDEEHDTYKAPLLNFRFLTRHARGDGLRCDVPTLTHVISLVNPI